MKKLNKEQRRFLFAIAALIFIVAVFGVLFFNYIRKFERTLKEENCSRLSEVSGHISNYMEKMMSEQLLELGLAANFVSSVEETSQQVEYLEDIAEELGFEYIGIADSDGRLAASVFPEPEDVSEEEYFKAASMGKVFISDITRRIFYDKAVGGVIMSVPVPGKKGQILAAMVSTAKLGEDVQVDSFDKEGYSYVINRNGDLVIHARSMEYNNLFQSMENMEFASGYSLDAMRDDILGRREGMTAYSDFGIEKFAYYRPMEVNGWTVVSTVPQGVITKRTAGLLKNLITLCAASMAVFLLMILVVCNMFLRLESRRRANRAKSVFLANMSHDMRTPMNAIMGMTAIAGTHADEPELVKDCLKKITHSSRHLLGLINDILDMSRIESGKIVLSREPFFLAEVIEGLVDMIYPLISAKHQKFSIRLHGIGHEKFEGDSLRLSQIFINILTNAVKFTPEGGSIIIDIEELDRKDENTASMRFSFADNGIGMKAEFLKDVFSAFVRERDSKVDKIEGSGLGMAITKEIVELMGGSICVESEEGRGTMFTVILPLAICREEGEEQLTACETVLAAGGDKDQGVELVKTLEKMGIRALWAADGTEAAALISKEGEQKIRLILIDRDLLEHGDVDLIRNAGGAKIPMILAAYAWNDLRDETEAAGITGFVQKPLFPSVLRRMFYQNAEKEGGEEFIKPDEFDFNNRRVLLAEDNELNLEIIRNILMETGADVSCAKNGAECVLNFMESEPGKYDLILMDIQMPEMDGYEAARRIRALERADSGIPIFAMSANAYEEDIEAARKAGMTGYLTKPIDVGGWLTEISRYLAAGRGM
ncbi:response regulator [Clostridium sp. MCC353]|uniref:hybrid sensor histidine kinase/response regulator n=1 Tax=Clostridium sp. MCC353 TaxID=2592646 RepID=UPI001C01A83A|nr:response regulator [Clostridium sp. MCC353]MBT9776815.1 response regulator [Clostridium sp. MCC353]